ncbi:MAG: branched-chain amino acid ABC transporter substrate-binding protein [Actinomycetota bacterium]|nr:branched-chain amino acid ABC transporter substrate-binding protein [Actinomycetota bacterium]
MGALALSACSNSTGTGGGLGSKDAGGAGGSGSVYTVAFQGPLSGDNQQLGINEVNGAQLAVEQANATGNLGFTLKLLKADDGGEASKAPAAAAQILQDPTVMGVVGPSFSGTSKAVGTSFGSAGLAIVNPSASNGTLQTLGFKTWHRIVPNDFAEGPAMADWLAKKSQKVFVLNDLSDYGAGVAGAVEKELKAKGIAVVTAGVDAKTTDYGATAQIIKQSGATALFYGGYDAQAALLAKALTAVKYTGLESAGNGVKSSVFTSGAGASGDGWYFSCGCQDATVAPDSKAFTAAYQTKFNTPPSTYSPEAFDATNLLIDAIKAAKAAGTVDRASVDAQVSKADFKGITGNIKFGPDGDLPAGVGTVNLFQQKAGKIVSLGDISAAS